MNNEVFDKKCLEIMENIVRLKLATTKEKALSIAEEMMMAAKSQDADKEVTKVFEKIIEEFKTVEAAEYKIFRKSIIG